VANHVVDVVTINCCLLQKAKLSTYPSIFDIFTMFLQHHAHTTTICSRLVEKSSLKKFVSLIQLVLKFKVCWLNKPKNHNTLKIEIIVVLKSLDLTVRPGETVAFVGQSGCGKVCQTKYIN
jgi:ABC-type glutathione transport system ATPase component